MKLFPSFGLNPNGKDKSLPIKYWTPKMHKEAIAARFIVVSKKCSKKLNSKVVSKVFQLISHQIESFYNKSYFYFLFKQFWAIGNSEPILEKFENINCLTFPNFRQIISFLFSVLI